jgi:hypothetical protein
MTQLPTSGPVVKVPPQPNLYTVLLGVANVLLLATIIVMLYNLFSSGGYHLSFSDFLSGSAPR